MSVASIVVPIDVQDLDMKKLTLGVTVGLLIGFFVGICCTIPHSRSAAEILKRIIDSPPAAAAILAAILAFIGGIGGPLATLLIGYRQSSVAQIQANAAATSANAAKITTKSTGNRALATIRLQWLDALRTTLSEYHSILMSAADDDELKKSKEGREKLEADERRLAFLGTQIDLLLNQEKPLQYALWQVSDKIIKLPSKQERQQFDQELVKAARAVLDFEWRKIKREMLGA